MRAGKEAKQYRDAKRKGNLKNVSNKPSSSESQSTQFGELTQQEQTQSSTAAQVSDFISFNTINSQRNRPGLDPFLIEGI